MLFCQHSDDSKTILTWYLIGIYPKFKNFSTDIGTIFPQHLFDILLVLHQHLMTFHQIFYRQRLFKFLTTFQRQFINILLTFKWLHFILYFFLLVFSVRNIVELRKRVVVQCSPSWLLDFLFHHLILKEGDSW